MSDTLYYLLFYFISMCATIVSSKLGVLPGDFVGPIITALIGHGIGTLPGTSGISTPNNPGPLPIDNQPTQLIPTPTRGI